MRLFSRSWAGMTLTPAGQALADRAPAVLAEWELALRETKAAASRATQVLRVGFISSAANEATQDIIAALLRLPFPGQDEVRTEMPQPGLRGLAARQQR